MTVNLALFDTTQLVIELTNTLQEKAWENSQQATTPQSRWQNYLNLLTLNALLPVIQEEQEEAVKICLHNKALANNWELVNGTVITVGNAKLALIPSEAEDIEEFRVPQEWVDIPQWVADYYLAVQVNIDAGFIRVWGYTTHQNLKHTGTFDYRDRTYTIEDSNLIKDLNSLWVARELCPEEVTQAQIADIPAISPTQAHNLIQRLGDPENLVPRLTIPFAMWAALLQNPAWRNALIEKRRGMERVSVMGWLQAEASNLVTEFGWRQVEFQPATVGARGAISKSGEENETLHLALARKLTISGQSFELKIIPVDSDTWSFQLHSLVLGGMIPPGLILRLLTEDMQEFEDNEDTAITPIEMLSVEVVLDQGEGIVWEIEPTPDDYQAEVLWF